MTRVSDQSDNGIPLQAFRNGLMTKRLVGVIVGMCLLDCFLDATSNTCCREQSPFVQELQHSLQCPGHVPDH